MSMKSTQQRRIEAEERAKNYTYENSKAKRLGTGTKEYWEKRRKKNA